MTEANTFAGQSNGYDEAIDPATRAFSGQPRQTGDIDLDSLGARAGDGVRDALNQLSDEIEARPEIAAGVAMFVGVLLGLALGRPSRAIVYIKD